jgi:nicotinate dehydrogenase subunit A
MTTPSETSTQRPDVVSLRVNGQTHEVRVDPATPLIYVLRNDLGLKAAKLGCGLEQCGACKVLIDGEALPSCRVPVSVVAGSDIVTLEGIGGPDGLHAVQQAFIDAQAVQCGYCAPGLIVAAVALLAQNPTPSDSEIREGLERHLCRCGTYTRIVRAVQRAAKEMAS